MNDSWKKQKKQDIRYLYEKHKSWKIMLWVTAYVHKDLSQKIMMICKSVLWAARPELTLLLLFDIQFMHDPESLQELIKINTAVFVEVDASSHVVYRLVIHGHSQMRTEELPGVTELLDGDLTYTCRRTTGLDHKHIEKN